uniref:Death inducer-obliterator 1 n=1 Tax=Poecilia formosa TaxID=48698 RepID=A0A096M2H0_POEFO
MDTVEKTNAVNDDGDSGSTDEQSQSGVVDSGARPSLSQVKKSWGFRRTTIAKREFMEEVGDLTHSPPPLRRGRSRRTNQAPETNTEEDTKQKATRTARSVIEDLQWSAPSSPASEDSKEPPETSAGGSFDPSLWQDFGSAFHTAFSLLGGNEGLSLTDALAVPSFFEPANEIELTDPQPVEENETPDNLDEMEVTQPVAPAIVGERESDYVVVISSQEEDSDEKSQMQIKEQLARSSRQGDSKARGGNGGRGKGRGRAAVLQSIMAVNEDTDDEVVLVNADEQQDLPKDGIQIDPQIPPEMESTSAHFGITLNAALQSVSTGCVILDSDFNQSGAITHGQFDDAPDEVEGEEDKNQGETTAEISSIAESEGQDSNATCFVCSQMHIKRFMICCSSCQEWFHSACVGISETWDETTEERDQDYMCLTCTTTRQSIIHLESHLEPDLSFPECLTLSPPAVETEPQEEQQQVVKEAVLVEEKEEEEEREALAIKPQVEAESEVETKAEVEAEVEAEGKSKAEVEAEGESKAEVEADPQCEMEADDSFPLCTGPGCAKPALPDSVYCGTDCILQHAAITMKTLSSPKVPKSKGRPQRKAAAKAESSCRTSKRLARKAVEVADEVEAEEDQAEREEPSASPKTCDPNLTDVQSTSIPSSNLNTTSADETSDKPEPDTEAVSLPKQCPEEPTADAPLLPQPVAEEPPLQSPTQEKEPESTDVSNQQKAAESVSPPPTSEKSDQPAATQAPPVSAVQHLEMGALIVKKTTYVIPKKQPVPQASCSQPSQKPSAVPALLSETRNLLVPPAPSAPSSRPSQPNNQVRQSIQRSLTAILFKRVSDCDDLEMPESEVVKLVAGIEKEMFDIFRNTDSKYMNKYRTIMFNIKDPRNKGLLYRVVNGEIGPFRLVRMTQKDMQATKAPEPTTNETTQVKVEAAKGTNIPKPEAVKIDLPSLNPPRPERKPESTDQKKVLPSQPSKSRVMQLSKSKKMPDILSCMLKDTTSEHKAHLFDLKCKICTGQMQAAEGEEPAKKKFKVSTSRDKTDKISWKKPGGDESPLLAPPDTPEMESPRSSLMEPSSQTDIDSPKLTIVESPASPMMDSPASPALESPASPIMESPASPTPEGFTVPAPKRSYTPVVIPTVSTVTITRRDPRTAANRFTASSGGNIVSKQAAPYAAIKGSLAPSSAPSPSVPPPKALPKSILMKPSSSADPRLSGASSRATVSQTPTDGDTAQFLAKQGILWKGFVNMLTVAKFVTKGYLVSGPAENIKADLPDTIQIGGRILPETVWDYVVKLKTSVTKELCVIRFHPATEEEEVAYVSLFSYFSSRGRFGVVANISRSIKDVYLVPLGANESIPSILQPFEGPGLEKNRPNLLLGLAIVQKLKRPGSFPQEIEEKKPKVNMSKDPMWIPKPPVLYGSDKLDMFKPYDPETPATSSPPGSPSDFSSSGSITIPSLLSSIKATPSVSSIAATESTSVSNSVKNVTPSSSNNNPLQTILKTLFGGKESDPTTSSDGSSPKATESSKKRPVFPKVSGPMVDPIVQQYGQKSKVKRVEQEEEKEDDFDRPYDPEEEYDPAKGYKIFTPQITDSNKTDDSALSGLVEDDVAYDPEDETIFEVFQSDVVVTKLPIPAQNAETPTLPTSVSDSTPATLKSNPTSVVSTFHTGAVVVSAATLSEQQRMLEELNKQIEEQKRQLKEQEEVLRKQREAVGMFMAHFSVSDTLMSPPTKSLPLGQLSAVQSAVMPTDSKPADKSEKVNNNTVMEDNSGVKSETVKLEHTNVSDNLKDTTTTLTEQMGTKENAKECEKYSSAGEIEDSDVAYDPEDESLFDEIQDDVFKGGSTKTNDGSSRTGDSVGNKGNSPNSHHSRRRRSSPKRRSRRERDRRSPSRRSRRRSRSHSRRHRDKDRHRSERERSRHRTRDPSDYPGHHRKDHAASRHSHGLRRSSSSPRRKQSASLSPKHHRGAPLQVIDKTKHRSGPCNPSETVKTSIESTPSVVGIKNEPNELKLECNLVENPVTHSVALIQNVKTEILEPSISQCDNQMNSSPSQENKLSLQETWLQDKIESKIPLREIDPPLRDSPESPDPEPQFSKPFSTESVDCAKTTDSEEQNSASATFLKDENDSVVVSRQTTSSLQKGPNIQDSGPEMDAVLHNVLPGPSFQSTGNPTANIKDYEHSVTQTDLVDKKIGFTGPDRKGLDMQHIMRNALGPIPSTQNTHADGSERRAMQQATCLQGSLLNLIKNHNPNVTDSQTVSRVSPDKMQGTESSSFQVINQGVTPSRSGVMQNVVQSASNSEIQVLRTQIETQNQFVRSQLSDRPLPGSNDSVSAVQHRNPNINDQNVGYYREPLPFLKTDELRSQPKNADSKSDIMKIDTSFGSPQFEGRISHPGTLGSHIRMVNKTGHNPSFFGFRGDQTHSKHTESLSFDERGLGKRESQHIKRDPDFSDGLECGDKLDISNPDWRGPGSFQINQNKGLGPPERPLCSNPPQSDSGDAQKGLNRESTDPVRIGTFTQNDWRTHQFGERVTNLESQGPCKIGTQNFQYGQRNKERSPDRQTFKHDFRGPRGTDFVGPRTEIRNPELHLTRNDTSQPVCSDMMGKWSENKGPDTEASVHGRREPVGPDFKIQGPEWIGPRNDNSLHDSRGPGRPDLVGQRLEQRNWPERRAPDAPGPGIDQRGPNMEGPRNEWRGGGGGPNFRGGPETRGLSMEQHRSENREFRGPVFRGPGPEGRYLTTQRPGPDKISEHPNFIEQGLDNTNARRMTGGPDFSRPVNEMRSPAMDSQNSDRRGSQEPENWRPGSERKGTYLGRGGPDSIEQGRILLVLEGPKPVQGGPHFRGNVTEGACLNSEGSEHRGRSPNLRGCNSDMVGSELNRTGPGVPRTGRIGPPVECTKGPNIRDPRPERVTPNVKQANRSPPRDSQFRCPEQGRTFSNMEGLQPNRNMVHPEEVEHNRNVVGGPGTTGMGPRFCRRPDYEGPVPDEQNPRGPSFREPMPVRPRPGMDGRRPDWRESSDCRDRGAREERANTEDLGYDRQNDWGEAEPVQEFPDFEELESDRRGQNFRPSRLMRRSIRRPGPNARGFAPSRRGGVFEGKWLDRRGPRFEELEGGESSGDIWDNSGDRGLETFQDHPDEQGEGHSFHDNHSEWTKDGENVQFSVSEDDWDGPGFRHPRSVRDNPDMDCPGPNREREEHEWTESDREDSGAFFRGRGGPCNRRQSWCRVRGRGRGSVQQRHANMDDDWRHQDFEEDMRGHDRGTPWPQREAKHPNRRPFEMEAPGGPDLRYPETSYRNFNDEGPKSDRRVSDFGESSSERRSIDMDAGADPEGFERNFRRVRRGPIMRQGPSSAERRGASPNNSDFRPGRWDSNSEFPESNRRDVDRREREQRHPGQTTSRGRRGPHQGDHGPHEGPPAPFNRPLGPGPNREGHSFHDFDSPQNQQAVQPQRHRGALLPTPDGPVSDPVMKSHDASSMKAPQFGSPFNRNRGTSRGRAMDNWFRGRARGPGRGAPAR